VKSRDFGETVRRGAEMAKDVAVVAAELIELKFSVPTFTKT